MNIDDLSDEIKEKAMTCKSSEELVALASEQGLELSDEELESVVGGAVWEGDDEDEPRTNFVDTPPKPGECMNMSCVYYYERPPILNNRP